MADKIQFGRKCILQVIDGDGVEHTIDSLRMTFEIEESLTGFPGLAKIQVYNLSRARVTKWQEKGLSVTLRVGYGTERPVKIFEGSIRNVMHTRQAEDSITEIYAADALRAFDDAFHSSSYAGGASLEGIVRSICASMEVEPGSLSVLSGKRIYSPLTLSGKCSTILKELAVAFDFYWAIQGGVMFVIDKNGNLDTEELVVINKNTGMIGSPTLTEIGAEVTILINPLVRPFRLIQIESADPLINIGNLQFREVKKTLGAGLYRVQKITHSGDTHGDNWQSSIIGRTLIAPATAQAGNQI